MNQTIVMIALAILLLASGVHLVRVLRSDGYGKLPPPRSHHDQVRAANDHRRLV